MPTSMVKVPTHPLPFVLELMYPYHNIASSESGEAVLESEETHLDLRFKKRRPRRAMKVPALFVTQFLHGSLLIRFFIGYV